jgi:hypothetical protein
LHHYGPNFLAKAQDHHPTAYQIHALQGGTPTDAVIQTAAILQLQVGQSAGGQLESRNRQTTQFEIFEGVSRFNSQLTQGDAGKVLHTLQGRTGELDTP